MARDGDNVLLNWVDQRSQSWIIGYLREVLEYKYSSLIFVSLFAFLNHPASTMSTTQGSDSEYQCTWLSRTRFNELLEEYRESATPERRAKIFINQEMYNDIKGVLEVCVTSLVFHHYLLTLIILQKGTRCNRQRGSKFVLWARKRFKLTSFANNVTIVTLAKDENKTIAIEEQLYKTITKAHEDCQHGGKHATLARVSKLVDRLNVTYIYT